jgi:Zn-dependent peptidase ImmA (M78 family)
MLKYYYTTALEDWVTNKYKRLRILHPEQINIDYIAKIFDIRIKRTPLPSFHDIASSCRWIFVDNRKNKREQREIFFHEFGHILRHTGVQTMLPSAFRELQEWDARHFTMYAAIPYHMLNHIDFNDEYVIDQMTSLFKVTPELCEERLEQIKNRCMSLSYVSEKKHKYNNTNY